MAIGNLMEFEAIVSELKMTADKIHHMTTPSVKFENARRTFQETVDVMRRNDPIDQALAERITAACDVFISELGAGERAENQLFDLQDYLEFNPPAPSE